VAALLSGDVDFISPVPPQDFNRIEKRRQCRPVHLSGRPHHHLPAQPEAPGRIQNVRVRQAIVHAINNAGIVKKIMKGTATAAGQQSPKGYAGYNPASSRATT
jgi:peptide/nickel transport system substrate-binding protein